jgi:WD40 repeat protein
MRSQLLWTLNTVSLFLLISLSFDRANAQATQPSALSLAAQVAADSNWVRQNRPAELEFSTLLAIESMRRGMFLEGGNALRRSLDLLRYPTEFKKYAEPVNSIAFSDDGHWLALGANGGNLYLIDRTNRLPVYKWREPDTGAISAVAFSPDSRYVAAGTVSSRVYIHEIGIDTPKATTSVGAKVIAIAFGRGGRRLAIASDDGVEEIRDLTREMQPLHLGALHHSHPLIAATFGPEGHLLVTADPQGMPHVIDIEEHRELPDVLYQTPARAVSMSSDGQWIAIADNNSITRVFDAQSGREVAHIVQNPKATIDAIAFNNDCRQIAIGSSDGTVRVYEWRENREIARLRSVEAVKTLAFDPAGAQIVIAGVTGMLTRFVITDRAELFHKGVEPRIVSMALSPDEQFLALGGANGEVYVYSLKSGKNIFTDRLHQGWITALRFSGGNDRLAIADERSAKVVSIPDGHQIWFVSSDPRVEAITLSNDGRLLGMVYFAFGKITARIIDLPTSNEIPPVEHAGIQPAIAVSGDGKLFATTGSKSLHLFRADTGRELPGSDFDGIVGAAAFSPLHKWIAIGTSDHKIHLVDVTSAKEVWWASEGSSVILVAFDATGKSLATATSEGVVHIYDALGHSLIAEIETGETNIKSLAFSGDGQFLVVAYARPRAVSVKRYSVTNEALIHDACALLSQKVMNEDQWNGHFYGEARRPTCP